MLPRKREEIYRVIHEADQKIASTELSEIIYDALRKINSAEVSRTVQEAFLKIGASDVPRIFRGTFQDTAVPGIIEEAFQKICSLNSSGIVQEIQKPGFFTVSQKSLRQGKINENNMLCVYLVTALEYCLKTAFEINAYDRSWRNDIDHIYKQAGRFGYRNVIQEQLDMNTEAKRGFRSLVTHRKKYIHQREDVSATLRDQKKFFEDAKDIINLIVETMPDRYFFQTDTETQHTNKKLEQIGIVSPIVFQGLVEPTVTTFSSSELPNHELVISIQEKKTLEENN